MQYVEQQLGSAPIEPTYGTSVRIVDVDGHILRVPANSLVDSVFYKTLKRIADIIIAITAIVIFSPIFLVATILIWLEDRGPVLYFQTRIGTCGAGFRFFKFRSMHLNADKIRETLLEQNEAEGVHFKIKGDPRITRVGKWLRKFSIDELPQLFCVLSGKMSIVGPRPHLPAEVACYVSPQEIRLLVKPGLLCLREVRGRSNLNFEEWVSSDIEYVINRSLWLDLKIFVLAFPAVVSGRGAY